MFKNNVHLGSVFRVVKSLSTAFELTSKNLLTIVSLSPLPKSQLRPRKFFFAFFDVHYDWFSRRALVFFEVLHDSIYEAGQETVGGIKEGGKKSGTRRQDNGRV